ncbi:hypothetical protein ACIRBZ_35335 [Streptomyces sp. NPDC094038]|uniref:hypothetical protein n=1 Tax=Streptomyces sp. NPDC094038 TaxID=3366055 RepID=UPI003826B459
MAPLVPLQVALAGRVTAAGAGVVRAALPPLADLTEAAARTAGAAGPALIAAEELAVTGLEQLQPLLLASAARAGRVVVAVTPA